MEIWMQILVNGILTGGIFALISIGLTLIFGVMNIINFAHGEFLMISMYLVYWMNVKMGMDPYVAIIFIIPIMFVVGLVVYKATLNPIIERSELFTILMTVALMILLQNLALMLWNADIRSINIDYAASAIGTENIRFGITKIASFAIAIGTAIGLMIILSRTWIGKSIKATSQNRTAAKLMGVDTIRTYTIAFALGIATVGIAGAALAPIFSIYPTVGTQFGTASFVVVVLGGLGNVPGAIIGGLIIGLIDSISGFLLPVGFKEAIYLGVFLLVLLLKPNGLFGQGAAGGGR
ncbi:MAG: branched-chain amino acid ABC transporter permease [Syntrophomonadaceae bacterium]|jgi:branched-chain amino acid transport system permease protein|nr:branched-chain amino acid ABC transporter permease [Syntrophomonadaceae bacterium]